MRWVVFPEWPAPEASFASDLVRVNYYPQYLPAGKYY